MRRALHFVFWTVQPAAAVSIGLGILLVEIGRRVLRAEARLRR